MTIRHPFGILLLFFLFLYSGIKQWEEAKTSYHMANIPWTPIFLQILNLLIISICCLQYEKGVYTEMASWTTQSISCDVRLLLRGKYAVSPRQKILSLQTSVLCLEGKLAGGALPLVKGYRVQVTYGIWHMIFGIFLLFTLFKRFSVSNLFFQIFFFHLLTYHQKNFQTWFQLSSDLTNTIAYTKYGFSLSD